MQEAAHLAFERKLTRQLAADAHAETSTTPLAGLQERVHQALVRGRRHGITSQSDLAEFGKLLFEMGGTPPGPEPKWLRRILTDPKLEGSARVLQIRERLRAAGATGGGAG
jgi:hypothetical protein